MVDALIEHPRLVAAYDALDGDRSDLDGYAAMHRSLGRCRCWTWAAERVHPHCGSPAAGWTSSGWIRRIRARRDPAA